MKKHLFAISFIALLCSLAVFFSVVGSVKADGSVEINSTNFPDSYFREYVKKKDKDGNNVLTSDELENCMSIYLRDSALSSIKGYELLPNLKVVSLYNCDNIRSLEIRSLAKDFDSVELEYCDNLTTVNVDVPNADGLRFRLFANEKITSVNLTCEHVDVLHLYTARNVSKFDLSHIGSIGILSLNSSKITSIDLSPVESSIKSLDLSDNRSLASLDVSRCTKLERLVVSNTALTSLDIKNNTYLGNYDCTNTSIKEVCTYYAPRLNQALFNGDRTEKDTTLEYIYWYDSGMNYSIKAPKGSLVWGKSIYSIDSNKIKDPLLKDYILRLYDYNEDKIFNSCEIFDVQNIQLSYSWNGMDKITTLEDMSIFTNLQSFLTVDIDYDVADLGFLHSRKVSLNYCKINKLIIPDNIDIEELILNEYSYDPDNIYLGHQKTLRSFNCATRVTQEAPLRLLDISDCPNLIEAYLNGNKVVENENFSNSVANCKYTTADGKMLFVPEYTRVKYGKDILVDAQNGTIKGAGEHRVGEKVTLTAVPNTGYMFDGWFENDTLISKDKSISFTSEKDRNLVAKFHADPNAPKVTPTSKPVSKPTGKPGVNPTSAPVTGKPGATSKPTSAAKPTSASAKPTAVPTAIPSADPQAKQIMEFVKRIYVYVLDREPEEEGAAFWSGELWAFRRTGAEVAQGFIFSAEFENRNTSDKEFVTILYKTFFGRDPEEEGMNFWLSQLSSGTMDRVTVANGFIYSQEWADTCASYGIRSGGELKPTGAIEPTELTYGFVERLYTTALGRGYDEEGRQYWASELANFNITGENAGASFFLSDEMTGFGLSDEEFLGRLYATFMDREADEDGKAYWLGVLESSSPRSDVVFGFTRSPEFTDKCVAARILPF